MPLTACPDKPSTQPATLLQNRPRNIRKTQFRRFGAGAVDGSASNPARKLLNTGF
jgi:hypothetical protein